MRKSCFPCPRTSHLEVGGWVGGENFHVIKELFTQPTLALKLGGFAMLDRDSFAWAGSRAVFSIGVWLTAEGEPTELPQWLVNLFCTAYTPQVNLHVHVYKTTFVMHELFTMQVRADSVLYMHIGLGLTFTITLSLSLSLSRAYSVPFSRSCELCWWQTYAPTAQPLYNIVMSYLSAWWILGIVYIIF